MLSFDFTDYYHVLALAAVSSAGLLVALLVMQLHWLVPLSGIPGPLLARWTPLWLFYHSRQGQRYKAVHEAHLV